MNVPNTNLFEFERVDTCALCGSKQQLDARGSSWHGVAFSYCICGGCGLKYMRPRPTTASYERFYKDDYWQQNLAGVGYASSLDYNDTTADQLELRMPKYKRAYEHVRDSLREIGKLERGVRVLEIGCAFGFTLEWLARDFGCKVAGVEPSSEAIKRCEEGGVPIIALTGEDLAYAEKPVVPDRFDVILFRHALDPIADPVGVLRGIRRYLSDDGVLLIHCVNVEFYDAMDPYHPFLYSPATLKRLLAKTGYEVFKQEHSPSPTDRKSAVAITSPSYQQIAYARKGEPRELPLSSVDAMQIAKTQRLGAAVMAWHNLGIKDLLWQVALRSLARSKKTVEKAYKKARATNGMR
jgi:SAM-dependent methyltransferase